jgi:hypothetical protein
LEYQVRIEGTIPIGELDENNDTEPIVAAIAGNPWTLGVSADSPADAARSVLDQHVPEHRIVVDELWVSDGRTSTTWIFDPTGSLLKEGDTQALESQKLRE